jgi:hypothetical protein
MTMNDKFPKLIEPLKSNRFIINFNEEVKVPEYLFTSFKIYNEGDQLIFKTKIYQTVNYSFNPSDIFKITDIRIEYLDPVGKTVNGVVFKVKGSNLSYKNSYSDDSLSYINFRFIIDPESIYLIYKNS